MISSKEIWAKKTNKEQQQLPEDIIFSHILLKACAKSIIQSKAVRKSWYYAITNPRFIQEYLQNSRTRPTLLFTTHDQALKKQCFFTIENTHQTLELLYELNTATELSITQSVNGMFCIHPPILQMAFCESSAAGVYIFNPSTRELMSIPPMPNTPSKLYTGINDNLISYFFGFDVKTQVYKVVGINCNVAAPNLRVDGEVECGIFTVGGSSWRMIKLFLPVGFKPCCTPGVCVNGAIHWLVKENRLILAFDLDSESFRAFQLDHGIDINGITTGLDGYGDDEFENDDEYEEQDHGSSVWPCLIQVGTHLGVVEYNDDELRLWVLKDYNHQEWEMEHIHYPYDWNLMHAMPYGSSRTGEFYLVLNHNTGSSVPQIVCCDAQHGTHERIQFVENFETDDSSGVMLSLVDCYPENIMALPKIRLAQRN